MKKYVLVIGIFILCGCMGWGNVRAAHASSQDFFRISSFTADYYLSRDTAKVSSMKVEERIVALFPTAVDQNHGILRALPESYQGHTLSLNVIAITDGLGHALPYKTQETNGNLVLEIGDPNAYVHGSQAYDIVYAVKNVTQHFTDHDELYWNVNGDQWQQPFDAVEARLHIAGDLAHLMQTQKECFVGAARTTSSDCSITSNANGTQMIIATRALHSNETMTFVFGFQKDTFAAYAIPLTTILLVTSEVVLLGILPPVVAFAIVLRQWRRFGRDVKGKGVIVPEYLTPKDISVLQSSIVLEEKFEPSALSAQIIDLAVRHYFKIYETKEKKLLSDKTTYEIELVALPDTLKGEEQAVVRAIFGSAPTIGKRITITALQNKLYVKAQTIGKNINQQVALDGYFRLAPDKAKRPYVRWGVGLGVLGFIYIPFTIGVGVAGLIILIASHFMAGRTAKGVELRDYLYGLRDYMKLAEADRIKAMQSPHGRLTEKIEVDPINKKQLIKLYEKLLPYAMLFGIEKDWAKELAPLYDQAPPDWYSGVGTFQMALFVSSLSNFTAASTSSFTPPSSSNSSGFGGGGFAGGGGGGGGGGGW